MEDRNRSFRSSYWQFNISARLGDMNEVYLTIQARVDGFNEKYIKCRCGSLRLEKLQNIRVATGVQDSSIVALANQNLFGLGGACG
jgi:hypothetical protein